MPFGSSMLFQCAQTRADRRRDTRSPLSLGRSKI